MNLAVREMYIVLLSRLAITRSAHQLHIGGVIEIGWKQNYRNSGWGCVRVYNNKLELLHTRIDVTSQPVPITVIGHNLKKI